MVSILLSVTKWGGVVIALLGYLNSHRNEHFYRLLRFLGLKDKAQIPQEQASKKWGERITIIGLVMAATGQGAQELQWANQRATNREREQLAAQTTERLKTTEQAFADYKQTTDRLLGAQDKALADYRDYYPESRLDALGRPFTGGPNLIINSPMSRALEGQYSFDEEKGYLFKEDAAAIAVYRKLVTDHPRFPFGYYLLAGALRYQGDPTWRSYANQGVSILEKTTSYSGAHPVHGETLTRIKTWLAEPDATAPSAGK